MTTQSMVVNQRWRDRRDSYRPAGEVIATQEYMVAPIDETSAKSFVVGHHYSGSYPAARFRFGLFHRGQLAGVAVFSEPASAAVLTNVFPDVPHRDATELGRFVLLDEVPGNGETWFLGRAFELLRREGIAGVVSFSDPEPRTSAEGVIIFPGHIGTIYQAHNAAYLGRGTPRLHHVLPDGKFLQPRSLQKIRSGERGWQYAAENLIRYGAPRLACLSGDEADLDEIKRWLPRALAATTRRQRHPGNHRYAWGLVRSINRQLERGAYPKRERSYPNRERHEEAA